MFRYMNKDKFTIITSNPQNLQWFRVHMLTCFCQMEGHVKLFRPETTGANFVRLMEFNCKVVTVHYLISVYGACCYIFICI